MNKNKKGFTLIELLVVVAIIAILSAIAFVSIQGARLRAFDTQIRAELSQVRSNAELYYYDVAGGNGSYLNYPSSTGWTTLANKIPGCSRALLQATDLLGATSYQVVVQQGASPQRYIAWAPLCTNPDANRAYCVDSIGNAMEVVMGTAAGAGNILGQVRTVRSNGTNSRFNCACHVVPTPAGCTP